MNITLNVNECELATILAALRYYQQQGLGDPANRPNEIHEIAADCVSSLDDAGIDALCERINGEQPNLLQALEKAIRALNQIPNSRISGGDTYTLIAHLEAILKKFKPA